MENISQTGIHCQKLVSWTEFLTAFGRKQREMQKEKKKKKELVKKKNHNRQDEEGTHALW